MIAPGLLAEVPAAVYPATVGAFAAIATAIVGMGNRRKLNGLSDLKADIRELRGLIERNTRDVERHRIWHMVKGDKDVMSE